MSVDQRSCSDLIKALLQFMRNSWVEGDSLRKTSLKVICKFGHNQILYLMFSSITVFLKDSRCMEKAICVVRRCNDAQGYQLLKGNQVWHINPSQQHCIDIAAAQKLSGEIGHDMLYVLVFLHEIHTWRIICALHTPFNFTTSKFCSVTNFHVNKPTCSCSLCRNTCPIMLIISYNHHKSERDQGMDRNRIAVKTIIQN